MISAGELIYSQPRSAVQTGSPSQQTYRKRARFLTGSGRGPANFFGGLRARNFMKPSFKNPTSATVYCSAFREKRDFTYVAITPYHAP